VAIYEGSSKENQMFKKLLIAIDGSDIAERALDAGIALAKAHGASITILTATDPVATGIGSGGFGTISAGSIVTQLEEAYEAEAQKLLTAARARVEAEGLTAETLHLPRHRPADAIIETAEQTGIDTIVMGSHGRRGLGRLLLGSQAADVLARATIPVLIIR
jgi:nucleotide-binding universal stress UspA family protein